MSDMVIALEPCDSRKPPKNRSILMVKVRPCK